MRQTFAGLVVSQGKMNKTVKVRIQRIKFNRLVQKDILHYKDFLVHDEANKCKEGDIVRIQYVKPFSRRKAFAVTEIMKNKGTEWMTYKQEAPAQVAKEELDKLQEYKQEAEQRKAQGSISQQVELMEKALLLNENEVNQDKTKELQEKYNMNSWPPTPDMINLDFVALKKELDFYKLQIERKHYKDYVKMLMENEPDKAEAMYDALNKKKKSTSKGIKKNSLMAYLAQAFNNYKLGDGPVNEAARGQKRAV